MGDWTQFKSHFELFRGKFSGLMAFMEALQAEDNVGEFIEFFTPIFHRNFKWKDENHKKSSFPSSTCPLLLPSGSQNFRIDLKQTQKAINYKLRRFKYMKDGKVFFSSPTQ